MIDLGTLTPSDCLSFVGKEFTLADGEISLTLILQSVETLTPSTREGGAFSLQFVGPKDPELVQRIYHVSQKDFGEMDVFMVPIAARDGGIVYESIFN